MRIDIQYSDISQLIKDVMMLPGIFTKARSSALKSTGFWIRGEIRDYVESGGEGKWPKLHALTLKFWKKYAAKAGRKSWFGRTRKTSALYWLGKFARYRVNKKADLLQVDFGKSRKGEPGRLDPQLVQTAKRAEMGATISVTDEMRRFLALTKRKRPKKQIPGKTYFPLKKSTTKIKIPKRSIFAPVFAQVKRRVPGYFEKKFWSELKRYSMKMTHKDFKAFK